MNVVFIPVRGGSKSIPLKNIKPINGKPLVYWAAKAANDSECVDNVVIATDSNEIKKTVINFGLSKLSVYDRKPENASDTASTESVMLEYIEQADLKKDDKFFLVQATSPMLKKEHIEAMYSKLINSSYDSMFSGVREKQFHWIETADGVHPINYDYKKRPRRQEFEGIIAENGACYINTVGNILRDRCRLSGKIGVYELPSYTSYEIDEESDWVIVEELMKRFQVS